MTKRHSPSLRPKPAHSLPCSPRGWTSTQAGIAGGSHDAQPTTMGWPVSPLRSAGGLRSSSVPPGSAFRDVPVALSPGKKRERQAACSSGLSRRSAHFRVRAARTRPRASRDGAVKPHVHQAGKSKDAGHCTRSHHGEGQETYLSHPRPLDPLPELSTHLLEAVARNGGPCGL